MDAARRSTSVIIADDHKIVRDGLRVLLERVPGFQVVADAPDGRTLVDRVLALAPDVVLTDMAMQELNGIEATRQLRSRGYAGTIVMLSMHNERRVLAQAFDAGVNAFVHKEHAFAHVLDAIAAARRGEVWLSPELEGFREGDELLTLPRLLSTREREVLQLFAEGRGTKEVAAALSLSPKTVEVHRANLFAKLKVNNVVDLTRIALKEGVVHI
jgi:DNA-binding NarL/FixJ family response regulator